MDPFLGEIRLFPWEWPPKGWSLCAGQLITIPQNTALFALLGTTYGGNGTTTFALPDLRGRVPIDRSSAEPQGARDGTETVTLNNATMPIHDHALIGTSTDATERGPTGRALGNDSSPNADFYAAAAGNPLTTLSPTSIAVGGGNQPHNNMQPFLVLNYCIATIGIFPARN